MRARHELSSALAPLQPSSHSLTCCPRALEVTHGWGVNEWGLFLLKVTPEAALLSTGCFKDTLPSWIDKCICWMSLCACILFLWEIWFTMCMLEKSIVACFALNQTNQTEVINECLKQHFPCRYRYIRYRCISIYLYMMYIGIQRLLCPFSWKGGIPPKARLCPSDQARSPNIKTRWHL